MAMIGIDVSKAKLDCMWLRDPVSLKVKSKVLPNTVAGYQALLVWLTALFLCALRVLCGKKAPIISGCRLRQRKPSLRCQFGRLQGSLM